MFNTYTPDEIESIFYSINTAIDSMKPCKEDKEVVKCLTCNKRQAIFYMKQVKRILRGKTYMNDNNQ